MQWATVLAVCAHLSHTLFLLSDTAFAIVIFSFRCNLNMLLNYQPHIYSGCYTAIISVLHEQNNEQLLFDSLFPPSSFQ